MAVIPGIHRLLIIKEGKVGLVGDLPELVRHGDRGHVVKITRGIA